MNSKILINTAAREALSEGIRQAVGVLAPTMGPRGRNVSFDPKYDVPLTLNSSLKILEQISLMDPAQNVGVTLLQQTVANTSAFVGDGCCCTSILTNALLQAGKRAIASGCNPVPLIRGMKKVLPAVTKSLDILSHPITNNDQLRCVIRCACSEDSQIEDLLMQAFDRLGPDALIEIQDSQLGISTLEIRDGCVLDFGFPGCDEFIPLQLNEPAICIFDHKLDTFAEVQSLFNQAIKEKRDLLFIATDITPNFVGALKYINDKTPLNAAAVGAPGYGETRAEYLQILAELTGTIVMTQFYTAAFPEPPISLCGSAAKAILTRKETVIQGCSAWDSPAIQSKIRSVTHQLRQENNADIIERLQETLSLLRCKKGVLCVGGTTELEMFERKYLFEHALKSAKAALDGGILAGGGVSLLYAAQLAAGTIITENDEERYGAELLLTTLIAPAEQILHNAGYNSKIILEQLKDGHNCAAGFNVVTEEYEDFYQSGIVDAAPVVREALKNAVSLATSLLSAEAVLC